MTAVPKSFAASSGRPSRSCSSPRAFHDSAPSLRAARQRCESFDSYFEPGKIGSLRLSAMLRSEGFRWIQRPGCLCPFLERIEVLQISGDRWSGARTHGSISMARVKSARASGSRPTRSYSEPRLWYAVALLGSSASACTAHDQRSGAGPGSRTPISSASPCDACRETAFAFALVFVASVMFLIASSWFIWCPANDVACS